MLQPPQRASVPGGLSAFEELASAGNPWSKKPQQPGKSQLGDSPTAPGKAAASKSGAAGASNTAAMPTSRMQPQAAGSHLIAQRHNQQTDQDTSLLTAQQQPQAAAAAAPDDGSSIAAGWGSQQRIRASADLEAVPASIFKAVDNKCAVMADIAAKEHPLAPKLSAATAAALQHATEAPRVAAPRQQQPAAAMLTATSMQLALRLRDYCELIRSVRRSHGVKGILIAFEDTADAEAGSDTALQLQCTLPLLGAAPSGNASTDSSRTPSVTSLQGAAAGAARVRGPVHAVRAVPAARVCELRRRAACRAHR